MGNRRIESLERELCSVLGKMEYRRSYQSCSGKYHGFRDFFLCFEDNTRIHISTGRSLYERRLEELVADYKGFYENMQANVEIIQAVVKKDNLIAVRLGVPFITYVKPIIITWQPENGMAPFLAGLEYQIFGREEKYYSIEQDVHLALVKNLLFFRRKLEKLMQRDGNAPVAIECGIKDNPAVLLGRTVKLLRMPENMAGTARIGET